MEKITDTFQEKKIDRDNGEICDIISAHENKVILIESRIRSAKFFSHLRLLIEDVLDKNSISITEIKNYGYFYIVKLKNEDDLLDAFEFLSKISGYSYIVIAKELEIDYDVLTIAAIDIGKKILYNNDKFSILVKSSLNNSLEEKDILNLPFDIRDFKFYVQSELSSMPSKLKYVDDPQKADKILFVFFADCRAYVGIYLLRGKNNMPFNFFDASVLCPIYDKYSLLSLFTILNAGFLPDIVVFYKTRLQLIGILKDIEKIVSQFSMFKLGIRLISLEPVLCVLKDNEQKDKLLINNSQNKTSMMNLIKEQFIIESIVKVSNDSNVEFVLVPFVPIFHPLWFLKKMNRMVYDNNRIPLNPFVFASLDFIDDKGFGADMQDTFNSFSSSRLHNSTSTLIGYVREAVLEKENLVDIKESEFEKLVEMFFPNGTLSLLSSADNLDDFACDQNNKKVEFDNYINKNNKKILFYVGKDDIIDILDAI